MTSNINDIIIDIDVLQEHLEMKKEKYIKKSNNFFYCTKGLVKDLGLKTYNNSIYDNNSKKILYAYDEFLEPISLNNNLIKKINDFHLVITLDGDIKIDYQGKVFGNKLYHNDYFIIQLTELREYCKSKQIKYVDNYYEYFNVFISNAKSDIKSEIKLEGNTKYYTNNAIIINDIPYINCLFEFYLYC